MKRTRRIAPRVPAVRQSAQQIWLAGLGAFALAGEEGGKLFAMLVRKGQGLEKLNRSRLSKVLDRVGEVRSDASRALGRLREPLDAGVTGALHQIGVPTRSELMTLTRRVEELTRAVEKKSRAPRRARKTHEPATAETV